MQLVRIVNAFELNQEMLNVTFVWVRANLSSLGLAVNVSWFARQCLRCRQNGANCHPAENLRVSCQFLLCFSISLWVEKVNGSRLDFGITGNSSNKPLTCVSNHRSFDDVRMALQWNRNNLNVVNIVVAPEKI